MPFRSEAQRRYLYAKRPAVAREFQAHTASNARLPEHVRDGRRKKSAALRAAMEKR